MCPYLEQYKELLAEAKTSMNRAFIEADMDEVRVVAQDESERLEEFTAHQAACAECRDYLDAEQRKWEATMEAIRATKTHTVN